MKKTKQRTSMRINMKKQISVIGLIVVIVAAIILIKLYYFPNITITENQRLYLLSTIAQVSGGLFVLLLTAYIFFIERFSAREQEDDEFVDAAKELTKKYYYNMICISVISAVAIGISIIGITLFNDITDSARVTIVTISIILACIDLVLIVFFAISLVDPDKVDKEITQMNERAKERLQPKDKEIEGSLKRYLKNYNIIEKTCSDWVRYCISMNLSYDTKNYQNVEILPLFQSMRLLHQNEIFNTDLWRELNEIRKNRNAVVRSTNTSMKVSQKQCDRIEAIANTLSKEFQAFKYICENSDDANMSYEAIRTMERIHNTLYQREE